MIISYHDRISSTQTVLIQKLKCSEIQAPYCIVASEQSSGFGSRGNQWISKEGDLFFSFVLPLSSLPEDLKLESSSIYFSYLLKELLQSEGSQLWIKWPNDFYIEDKKLGGTICSVVGKNLVCGIGVNLTLNEVIYTVLDINIKITTLLEKYFEIVESFPKWKQVFSKFKLEFEKSKHFETHYQNSKIKLAETELMADGSLLYENERIYSLSR
jgi:BirA family biotin operon repressor/biotin-[acetyl-CoA-carboxylase] ligase